MAQPVSPKTRISLAGWLRIALRLACLLAALVACVPLYYCAVHSATAIPFRACSWPWQAGFRAFGCAWSALALPVCACFFPITLPGWTFPRLRKATGTAFVAHDGLASVGALRWLCEMNKTVFIARHRRGSASPRRSNRSAAHLRKAGVLTSIPGRHNRLRLSAFKSPLLGAFENPAGAGASPSTVQPVWLDYGCDADDVAWLGEEPGLDNALRILASSAPGTPHRAFPHPACRRTTGWPQGDGERCHAEIKQAAVWPWA